MPAAPGDPVLAVGREGEVRGAQRAGAADLSRFLAEAAGPEAQLALPLQGGGFDVDPAHQRHVAVKLAVILHR